MRITFASSTTAFLQLLEIGTGPVSIGPGDGSALVVDSGGAAPMFMPFASAPLPEAERPAVEPPFAANAAGSTCVYIREAGPRVPAAV